MPLKSVSAFLVTETHEEFGVRFIPLVKKFQMTTNNGEKGFS